MDNSSSKDSVVIKEESVGTAKTVLSKTSSNEDLSATGLAKIEQNTKDSIIDEMPSIKAKKTESKSYNEDEKENELVNTDTENNEDVIDGFSFISFEAEDEIKVSVKNKRKWRGFLYRRGRRFFSSSII